MEFQHAGRKVSHGEWVEKVYDYVIVCNSLQWKISQMKVVEDFESRPHKTDSFVVERVEEIQEWNEQKLPKVLLGDSGGKLPERSTKEKGREDGEVDEDSGERRNRSHIAQEVVASIKEKASAHDGIKKAAQRPAGQSFMRSWDSSHIENEEEKSGDQMAAQWDEEQKLEEAPLSWRSCKRYWSEWCMNARHQAKG